MSHQRVVSGSSKSPLLSIGVFARRSRLSIKALRLYDRQGVLIPAFVDPSSGYRQYRETQLETARLVGRLRRLDMPLGLIREVIRASGQQRVDLVSGYWDEVERKRAYQRELASHLWIQLSGNHGGFEAFPVAEREVSEQLVLNESSHVSELEIDCWIAATLVKLETAAEQFGGVAGPSMIIFMGDLSDDGDGPVEVCVPIDPALSATPGHDSRRERAHWEAFTTITRAQYQHPQVLCIRCGGPLDRANRKHWHWLPS